MHIIPIGSKQISFIFYDDNKLELVAQYHTGEQKVYPSVPFQDYEALVHSTNKYDTFVQITTSHEDERIVQSLRHHGKIEKNH